MIDENKLIERLKQLKGADTLANMFISDVISAIRKQPKIGEWLCSEKLPANEQEMRSNNMDNEARYCFSWDGEEYFGDYATEEEALEDAKSEELHEEVYIGTCSEPELRWHGIQETVIEQIEDNLYEDVGEAAESFGVSVEDEKDLKTRLDAAIKGWIKERNIKPNCYQVFDGHRVPIEEV